MLIASSNFLVPNGTIIIEVVAFLIVLWFIARKVLPILNKALTERQEEIRASLEAADAARHEADETRAQRQGILDEARQQARDIVGQATRTAERVQGDGEARGRAEYERLVSSAEAEITVARQRAIDEVSSQVAALVLSVARQIVGREVDAAGHRAMIDEAVAALRSSAGSATGS